MTKDYITAIEFKDFAINQDKLIKILNHNMTKISVDVSWLKKLIGWQVGLVTAVAAVIFGVFIKLVLF